MSSDGCAFKSLTEFVWFGLNDDQMVVFLKMGVLNTLMSLVWFEWWLTSDGSVLKSLAQFGLVWNVSPGGDSSPVEPEGEEWGGD